MRRLLTSNDPVLLSFAQSLLRSEGIECFEFDQNISIMEGSIGAFPRRVLVREDDWPKAVRLLEEAELGQHIVRDEYDE